MICSYIRAFIHTMSRIITVFFSFSIFIGLLAIASCNSPGESGKSDAQDSVSVKSEAIEAIEATKLDILSLPVYPRLLENGKLKEELSFLEKVDLYELKYPSDGLTITGYLVRPKNDSVYPVIVFNRPDNPKRPALVPMIALQAMAKLASEGYVMITSNYRGFGGSDGTYEYGGSDLNDVTNLLKEVAEVTACDTTKVGLYGGQRGSMINLLLLKKSSAFDCIVNINGMYNPDQVATNNRRFDKRFSQYIPNYNESAEEVLAARTPKKWLSTVELKPTLFIEPANDSAGTAEADTLAKIFADKSADHHMLKMAGKKPFQQLRSEMMNYTINWFDFYLKGRESALFQGVETTLKAND